MKAAPKKSQTIDRYVIRRVLGTGAMGSVYAAWDPKLCREVALKVVPRELAHDPKNRARFLREARAIAAVRHPNIIEIYDYSGDDSEALYLVIEKLDGQDLFQLGQQIGPLPETVALAIAHELCLALSAAHDKGIVHRDLKPENVFITSSGRVVLTDFGIVKAITRTSAIDGFKEPTEIIGTPGFMAPEQLSGGHLGAGVDLFSLGVMLYNLTTGEMPFQGASPFEIFRAAAAGTYVTPREHNPQLGAGFVAIIDACLRARPQDRPASAEALRTLVRAAIEQLGGFDLREELAGFVQDPRLSRRAAEARTIAQLAAGLKVAMQDHDAAACESLKVRLALWAPRHPLLARALGEADEATVVDRRPAGGAPTLATGVHRRRPGLGQRWRQLPTWLRGLAASVVAASVLGGAGLGLWAQRAAQAPAPLQLAVIQPLAPARARPRAAGPVAVDLSVVGPSRALRLDGSALGHVRARRLSLAVGHHRLEVGPRGRGWAREFDLAPGAHADLRVDSARRQISIYAG